MSEPTVPATARVRCDTGTCYAGMVGRVVGYVERPRTAPESPSRAHYVVEFAEPPEGAASQSWFYPEELDMSEPTEARPQSPPIYWMHVARGHAGSAIMHEDAGDHEAACRECVAAIEALHDALARSEA